MSKNYELFLPWVLPDLPGCPEIAAIRAICDTAIQFCEQSLVHQTDHDPVSVKSKTPDYNFESPVNGSRIVKVMRAWFGTQELVVLSGDQVSDPTSYNPAIEGNVPAYSPPKYLIQKDDETFALSPIPDQDKANGITMRVALAPLRSSNECADFLFERWVEIIAAGAVARLQITAGKSYTNPQNAAINQGRFMAGVNAARLRASTGLLRPNLRVQFRKP